MADIPPYPLYNRTYQLYRVSPLHHGDSPILDSRTLRTHARRLRDQLKGDNVRGVEVDYAGTEGAMPNLGPLEQCNWDLIGDEDAWIDRHQQLQDPDASQLSSRMTSEHARGVEVTLEYESHSYNALLLRDPANTTSPDGFTSLPLLLLKMPAPIREVFLNYIKTTFDAYVSPLKLQPVFLTSTLELYFRHLTSSRSTQSIRDTIRQIQLQITFPQSTTLLKHIDVTIVGTDVAGFVSRGKRTRNSKETPFTAAISSYLQKHLALDLSHPKVQLSKITCSSFTLSTDRLKLVAPDILPETSLADGDAPEFSAGQAATQDFYNSLVREATGTGKFLPESKTAPERHPSTPSSVEGANAAGRRKRAVSTTAATNANTKRSKARGKENAREAAHDEDIDMQS